MTSTQLELEFEWRGLRLSGGLWLPDGTPPYPAVLMLQGSGSSDRDNDGYFPPLRAALVARGLAVYAFDKPGTGRSEGGLARLRAGGPRRSGHRGARHAARPARG